MLFFYFFTVKKMTPNIQDEKESGSYNYARMRMSITESLSLTLKEVSLQMEDDAERKRIYALLTCIFTVLFDIFLGGAAFVCAAITNSSAGYAFALDCMLDVVAASLVVWRLYGSAYESEDSDSKENKACFWLGSLLCVSAIGIIAKSACDLASHTVPQQLVYVFILAGIGGAMNSMLGGVKYWLGKKMHCESLKLEAVNTLLSAVLALMLAVSDILFYYHPSAWTIDPVTSIFVAVILFSGGIRVLCRRKRTEETTPLLASGAV